MSCPYEQRSTFRVTFLVAFDENGLGNKREKGKSQQAAIIEPIIKLHFHIGAN